MVKQKRFTRIASQKQGSLFAVWDGLKGRIYKDSLSKSDADSRVRTLNNLDSKGNIV